MNPFGVFDSESSCKFNRSLYTGKLQKFGADLHQQSIQKLFANSDGLKEIRFNWLDGVAYPIGISTDGMIMLNGPLNQNIREHIESAVKKAVFHCEANFSVIQISVLNAYDNYYYSHHGSNRPLPVYKVKLNDIDKTWIYINAVTGEWVLDKTFRQRVQRWLYNGLHSLDFWFLIERRPLWDFTVIFLCFLGFLMSITSLRIASRRLQIKLQKLFYF